MYEGGDLAETRLWVQDDSIYRSKKMNQSTNLVMFARLGSASSQNSNRETWMSKIKYIYIPLNLEPIFLMTFCQKRC